MKERKSISLLKRLRKKELSQFSIYFQTIYPKTETASQLLDFLITSHPLFSPKQISNEQLIQSFYLDTPDNEAKLSDDFSRIAICLEDFLILKYLKKNRFERDYLLTLAFKERQLEKLAQENIRKLQKTVNRKTEKDSFDLLKKFQLSHFQYFYANDDKVSTPKEEITRVKSDLDLFYNMMDLRYRCEMVNRNNLYGDNINLTKIDSAKFELIDSSSFSELYSIYGYLLDLLEKKSFDKFLHLKNNLTVYVSKLSQQELNVILSYLLNFISYKIKSGESNYINEALEIYYWGMKHKVLLVDNFLIPTHFINAVSLASVSGAFLWAEHFIVNNKKYLKSEIRQDTVKLANSILLFEKGEFVKVLKQLPTTDPINIFFKLTIRFLKLRSLVEIGEDYDLIIYNCKAFQHFLSRAPRLGNETINAAKNTISIIIKMHHGKPNLSKTRKQIEKNKLLFYKNWLLKIIDSNF